MPQNPWPRSWTHKFAGGCRGVRSSAERNGQVPRIRNELQPAATRRKAPIRIRNRCYPRTIGPSGQSAEWRSVIGPLVVMTRIGGPPPPMSRERWRVSREPWSVSGNLKSLGPVSEPVIRCPA